MDRAIMYKMFFLKTFDNIWLYSLVEIFLVCASYPVFADSLRCLLDDTHQWKLIHQLPQSLKKNYISDANHKMTVFKSIVNFNQKATYLIREDFNAGVNAAPADILVDTKQGLHIIFKNDVNNSNVPIVVLHSHSHGFPDLCNPYPCCGEPSPVYRFNGINYEQLK
jgi:hypothetical protein